MGSLLVLTFSTVVQWVAGGLAISRVRRAATRVRTRVVPAIAPRASDRTRPAAASNPRWRRHTVRGGCEPTSGERNRRFGIMGSKLNAALHADQ
ncbi:MAG: hypothetical protein CMJ83_01050 [Planctomycetes bacterium]|nr:hypothetical protein [Planctomycetota bacterium]